MPVLLFQVLCDVLFAACDVLFAVGCAVCCVMCGSLCDVLFCYVGGALVLCEVLFRCVMCCSAVCLLYDVQANHECELAPRSIFAGLPVELRFPAAIFRLGACSVDNSVCSVANVTLKH